MTHNNPQCTVLPHMDVADPVRLEAGQPGCGSQNAPFGQSPPESLFLIFAAIDRTTSFTSDSPYLSLLAQCNWRTHLYPLGPKGTLSPDALGPVLDAASRHLERYPLCTLYLHPFLTVDRLDDSTFVAWKALTETMKPYQIEAYEEQGETRFLVLPILEPAPTAPVEAALAAADFFKARLSRSSLYLRRGRSIDTRSAVEKEIRVYIEPAPSAEPVPSAVPAPSAVPTHSAEPEPPLAPEPISGATSVLRQFRINRIFEEVLERIEDQKAGLLAPCRRHLVLDEASGITYACLRRFEATGGAGLAGGEGEEPAAANPWELPDLAMLPDPETCRECIAEACLAMGDNVRANGREEEGRRVCFQLALACSERLEFRWAARLARSAFELAGTDADRAAALLHEGLCHLHLSEHEKADQVLREGAAYSTDSGLFAYHRGRVQFALRDYIEALDRFQEALASGSLEVPLTDLLFDMVVSHVHLEEYPEALSYLERLRAAGLATAPVSFYEGLCHLGQQHVEEALEFFQAALEAGPDPEDLTRVLFYVATCLKELERFDEAIGYLEKAIETDSDDYANFNLLGFCLYKRGRFEEAIDSLERALEIKPNSGIDHASIGSNLRELGRYEEALERTKQALALDPTLGFAHANLMKLSRLLEGSEVSRH